MSEMPLKKSPARSRAWLYVLASVLVMALVLLLVVIRAERGSEAEVARPQEVSSAHQAKPAPMPEPVSASAPALAPASAPAPAPAAFPDTVEGLAAMASAGNARACFELGERSRLGKGTIRDDEEALRWYERASACGDVDVFVRLAKVYEVWGYKARAEVLYEKAAFSGNHEAQLWMAHAPRFVEVPERYAWLNICASWGDTVSMSGLDALEAANPSSVIAKGQLRSREILKLIESGKSGKIVSPATDGR
jgi:hypothetical protein